MNPRRKTHYMKLLFLWHRFAGLLAAVFVLVLSVTGIALNHTASLELDQRKVENPALLQWYGIDEPGDVVSYQADSHRVSRLGSRIFLDGQALSGGLRALRGALALENIVVIAGVEQLWLVRPDGAIVEKMGAAAGVPTPVRRIGRHGGAVWLDTGAGLYRTGSALLSWSQHKPEADVAWARSTPLPDHARRDLVAQYRGGGLPMERVMLDLHSGRILGSWGPYVMDAAALLLVLLSITGTWMWLRTKLFRHNRRRKAADDLRQTRRSQSTAETVGEYR